MDRGTRVETPFRILHFVHAHHVVSPFNDHVNLNPTSRFGIRIQPRIDIGGDSGDSKCRLDRLNQTNKHTFRRLIRQNYHF